MYIIMTYCALACVVSVTWTLACKQMHNETAGFSILAKNSHLILHLDESPQSICTCADIYVHS